MAFLISINEHVVNDLFAPDVKHLKMSIFLLVSDFDIR